MTASKKKLDLSPSLLLLALVVFAVLLATILFGCNKDTLPPVAEPYYEIDVYYDGAERVDINETVVYQNSTGAPLTSIAFRLYANAFQEGAVASPFCGDAKNEYLSRGNFGGISVLSVKINRLNTDFVLCGTDDTVLEIPTHIEVGETAVVNVSCTLDLPYTNHRLGIFENVVNLTGFYPILCTPSQDGWRKDDYHHFGDPFVHQCATYYTTVTCPKDYVVAGSGQKTWVQDPSNQENQTTEFYAENIRDFALFLSKDFCSVSATAKVGDGVNVDYYYLDDTTPNETLSLAVDALERFSSAFGDYPHPTYTLVSSKFIGGGMEYGALSLTSSKSPDVIIHETAHQWWYGIVGSDQVNTPWLDEGLAEFSTYYYHVLKGDESAYSERLRLADAEYAKWTRLSSVGFNGVMSKPLYDFLTEGEYNVVTYYKGAVMLATIRDVMKDDRFVSALKDYVAVNKFGIATTADFVASFEKHHSGIDGIINAFVAGKDK